MKGYSKTWTWPLALAVGLSIGLANIAGAQAVPPTDPASVYIAFQRAVGTDIEAAVALVTDDAVLRIDPAPPGTPGLWTGKAQIRQALQYSKDHSVRGQMVGSPQVDGNKVTVATLVSNSFFVQWGVAPVQFSTEVLVEGGKIKSFTNVMAQSERARVGAAAQAFQAAHSAVVPTGMPATGGSELTTIVLAGLLAAGLLCIAAGLFTRRARWRA